jgi:hypothetical protein
VDLKREEVDDCFDTKSFKKVQEKVSGAAALRATTVPEFVSDRLLRSLIFRASLSRIKLERETF